MNWLARLKSGKTLELDATKTTETIFVVSVAPTMASLQKSKGVTSAANDSSPAPTLITATVDIGTIRPPSMSPFFLAASHALDASIDTADTSPELDPDALCWPHSSVMNGAEIDTFSQRLHWFTIKGLDYIEGESLADKLILRDRETDDRSVCLECNNFAGQGAGFWRCGNWQTAGIAIHSRDAHLPADLMVQLQRCAGFTAQPITTHKEPYEHDRH